MDPRFQRISEVFGAARRVAVSERCVFLDRACGSDGDLRREVEELLAAHDEPSEPVAPLPDLAETAARAYEAATPGPPPERLGEFTVLRRIATGGMGTVYEAEQKNPHRRVALKVLRPESASDEGHRRFALEAEVLARLRHPGIAQIHVFGTAETPSGACAYLAMELVEGQPFLDHAHALELEARIELLARVCDAVAHAHQNGVIHRDLKPSNILVTREGDPKVLDFGVARLVERETAQRTRTGLVIGTVAYMSPEQATGDPHRLDARSDVYSLGVLGYEMLCGALPHEAPTLPATLRAILEEDPVAPAERDRRLRGDVSVILMKALAKEPARRYQSASALAEDLRRHLRHEPILARPSTASYQIRKFVRRHRGLVAGTAATVAALVAGLVLALQFAHSAQRARDRAASNAEATRRAAARADVHAAAANLDHHAVVPARLHLERVPEDLRGWEWRYLAARLDRSRAHVVPPWDGADLLCFAPDLRTVAAAAVDRMSLFSAADGSLLGAWTASRPHPAFLAPDRPVLVSIPDGRLQVADARTGEILARDEQVWPGGIRAVAAHPRGRVGVALHGGDGNARIVVLDTRTGSIDRFAGDAVETAALAWSPDGERLAGGGWNMDVWVFDVAARQRTASLAGHGQGPLALAFSPDGARIASGSADKTARLWDAATGEEIQRFTGHAGEVLAVAFDPAGRRVVTGGADGTVRVWSCATGAEERTLAGHTQPVRTVAFDASGTEVVSLAADGLRRWSAEPARHPEVLRMHTDRPKNIHPYIYGVAFAPDGALLASAGWDGYARVVDMRTLREVAAVHVGRQAFDVAFTADGARIVTAQDEVALWDARTGERLAAALEGNGIAAVAASPDGTVVAAMLKTGRLHLLDAATLEPRAAWTSHGIPGEKLAFGPGGTWLASVSTSGRNAFVRDVPGGGTRLVLDGHGGGAYAVAASRDGTRIATGAGDGRVHLWNGAGRPLRVLAGHTDKVYALAFHPDGRLLASGANDNTIRLWEVETGHAVLELRGHRNYVYDLAFSPDGTTLASASGDNTVRLWSTAPTR